MTDFIVILSAPVLSGILLRRTAWGINVTLAVNSFGEGENTGSFLKNEAIYVFTSAFSGALSGFILHSLFSYVTSHVNFSIMSSLFLILAIVYFARDLINFPFPVIQWKWQIPPSWVSFSQPGNMAVWGLILGAGVFTYNPFPLFLLMYLYAGIFLSPVSGILIGLTFGLARSLASVGCGFCSG